MLEQIVGRNASFKSKSLRVVFTSFVIKDVVGDPRIAPVGRVGVVDQNLLQVIERALVLRLAAAPESPVGDVPTAVGAREHVIDRDESDTPCGEPRLTGRRVHGRMRLP